ncbi:MAG: peptide chain release factor N(5)-glutamine methyltransferase [Alphaproteobacteria bacterium]|jgi:release factor glutamine methyltransferase|nr:peptide chain release factor N(5)-glutamine methyltransferase [Alphaproteobacteria bacterium]
MSDNRTRDTLGAAMTRATRRLTDAGIPDAAADTRVLAGHVLGLDRGQLLTQRDRPLSPAERDAFAAAIDRRLQREPVSRIVGTREFWSLDFAVTPATLDPRPDSETVIAAVLDRMPDRGRPLRLLDLGTGTGCLLLALLSELPAAWGLGIDRSAAAVHVAGDNAARLGLGGRASFAVADWTAPLSADFDVVVGNPPYIADGERRALEPEVRLYDPAAALDGGIDGLEAYRAILAALPHCLAKDGIAALEIDCTQAEAVGRLARGCGLACLAIVQDLSGRDRAIVLCHKGSLILTKKSWILSDLPLGFPA